MSSIGGQHLILQKADLDGRSKDIYAAWTCMSVLFLKIDEAHQLICHSWPQFGVGFGRLF